MGFLAALAPIGSFLGSTLGRAAVGATIGGITGYATAPEENKLGGALTGASIGGLGTAGLSMGLGRLGIGKAAQAASSTGRIANSSWDPVSLLKSAYTPNAGGLMNLGMDVIPLISDISNNDVGLKSFSGFAGTMAGTRFGGRELNQAGENLLKQKERLATAEYTTRAMNRMPEQRGLPSGRSPVNARKAQYGETGTFLERNPDANKFVDDRISKLRDSYINDPRYSRQGYNMGVGMGADIGLYSLTSGMSKPKLTEQSVSPVTRYMQMTGAL